MFQAGKPIFVPNKGKAIALDGVQINKKSEEGLDEDWLQNLIDHHPECLPVEELEPGFASPVSICRELPTDHGPIDNFLMTPAGNIILVETKLWRNAQARREVIAQALDYASCIFEMNYSDLEETVRGVFSREGKSFKSIYSMFRGIEEEITEENFIDAVNSNLRRGRIMVLVVGDGIRTETERLTNLLQSHAGFHFTFALVELQIFNLPKKDGFMVVPRTLARTFNIDRAIVRIENEKIVVDAVKQKTAVSRTAARTSITSEQFMESMGKLGNDIPEKLEAFMEKLENIGINPYYLGSLNLKWQPPEGKLINFVYIELGGSMWTEVASWRAPNDLAQQYVSELAEALDGGEIGKTKTSGWHVTINGKTPNIKTEKDRLDIWFSCIERFAERIKKRLSEEA